MSRTVVARRAIHVPGVGACAIGAVLAADEPLVLRRPDAFDVVEPDLDDATDEEDD